MNFREWLTISEAVEIRPPSTRDDQSGADYVFDLAGLRWEDGKSLWYVAADGEDVVGAVVGKWQEDEDETWVYDFDVAVHPDYQGFARIGPKLIDTAIKEYERRKRTVPSAEMRIYAANPKVVGFLTSRYGFQIDDEYPNGKALLSRR